MSTSFPSGQPVAPEGYKLKKTKPIYKRWWFLLLAASVLIAVFASIGGGSDPATGNSGGSADAEQPATEATGIGQPVRDGKFEFTVSGVDCTRNELGTDPISTTAQGVFCIVSLNVTNVGDEAQYFDASSQKALDGQGREYSADSGSAIYLDNPNSFLEQLNPGSTVDGQLVYDVPAGTQLTQIELHDSMFSSGVTVNLS